MDVAQALSEYNALNDECGKSPEVSPPAPDFTPEPAARLQNIVPPSPERRRSSYERFSIVSVMPPLKEETTPNGSPFGTLTRTPDTLPRGTTPSKGALDTAKQHLQQQAKESKRENNIVSFGGSDQTFLMNAG